MILTFMRIEEITEGIIKQLHNKQIRQATTPNVRLYHYGELTWCHSVFVGRIALQLAKKYQDRTGIEFDTKLIKWGALVQDIGSYTCFDKGLDYATHGFIGRQILLQDNFPVIVANFASNHTGLTARDVEKLDLRMPIRDHLPQTLEEMLVYYADHFHAKSLREPRFIDNWKHIKARLEGWDKIRAKRRVSVLRD